MYDFVRLKTVLGLDALKNPIHEGDLLLDGSGRIYMVSSTENSFIRQQIVRVCKANMVRGQWRPVDEHNYVLGQFTVIVPGEGIPITPADRRSLYESIVKQRVKNEELQVS